MADHHQIVEQIRAFLQGSDQTRNERLDGLAAAYAEACADANQRLGRCHRLLLQGLRSEAIQQAEAEPRLLDATAALDFPERNEWDEIVDIYSLPAAPKPMAEARTALSEAYALAEPLQNLLRQHRRLATQRAPLRTRIGVMRKLASKDSKNPIWTEDLRIFEKARCRQIQVEASEAVRLQDAEHLTKLLSETRDRDWVESPPRSLVQGLTRALAQLRGEQNQAELAALEARLSESLSSQDATRGRTARDEWNALMATAALEPADPTWERVAPALRWLEDEDRRAVASRALEADLNALSNALNDHAAISAAELERLEGRVLSHGRGIPEKIQRKYDVRFRTARAARTRRSRIIAAAVAGAILVAGGLAFSLIWSSFRARDAEQANATIAAFLDKGDIEQAEGFLADLEKADASLLKDPLLVDARRRCRAARDHETQRAQNFEDAMEEARHAALGDVEPKALATARDLARLDSEKRAIEELVHARQAARKDSRDKQETTLRPRLDTISRAIERLSTRLNESTLEFDRFAEELDSSRRELDELKPQIATSGAELQQLTGDVQRRVEAVAARFDQLQGESQRANEITEAAAFNVAQPSGDLGLFASRLLAFVKTYPAEACSKAFQTTLQERPLWDSVSAWNTLIKGWKKQAVSSRSQEAELRARVCAQFLQKYPEFPDYKDVEEYRRYMEAIAGRTSGAKSPLATLKALFSSALVENLSMVVVKAGPDQPKRFYARNIPAEHNGKLTLRYIIDRGDRERTEFIPVNEIISKDPAPQSKLASKAKEFLSDQSKLERWETIMIDLLRSIANEPEIDPIVQIILLKSVVKAAGDGSEPMRISLERMREELNDATINLDVDWTNPETGHLAEEKKLALKLVESLRAKVPGENQLRTARDQLERIVLQTRQTVGWLVRGQDGIQVRTGVALPGDGDLWIVAPSAEKRGKWTKVGTITGGKKSIDTRVPSALAEGRPVFMIVPSS
jgi:hypothetical protein